MTQRIDAAKAAPKGYQSFLPALTYFQDCSLPIELIDLAYLRVSQINGCAYCIDKHSADLMKRGMPVSKLLLVPVWHEAQALFSDRFVSVVRQGHPLAGQLHELQPYIAGRHIGVAHRTGGQEAVDLALERLGLQRQVDLSVGSFLAALALARATDYIANVPERHTHSLREGMHSAALPVQVAAFSMSLIWHPRYSADPAHRWLRDCVREVVSACLAHMPMLEGPLPGPSGVDAMSVGAGGTTSESKIQP